MSDSGSGHHSDDDEPVANRHLFVDKHGFPISFFIHPSINNKATRNHLSKDIENYGGYVADTHLGCDTVLVDSGFQKKGTLQTAYNGSLDPRVSAIYVEYPAFVRRCIRENTFYHMMPPQKGMGGQPGRGRKAFSQEDDEQLCVYLSRLIPDKASGGRLGLNVYKTLVQTASVDVENAWAARHTAESWKQRYKCHAGWMDERIAQLAEAVKPTQKQYWPESRFASHAAQKRKHLEEEEEEEEVADEVADALDRPRVIQQHGRQVPAEQLASSPKRRRTGQGGQRNVGQPSDRARGKQRSTENDNPAPEHDDDDILQEFEGHSLFSFPDDTYGDLEPGPSQRNNENVASIPTHRTEPSSFFTDTPAPTLVNSGTTLLNSNSQRSTLSKARKTAGDSRPEYDPPEERSGARSRPPSQGQRGPARATARDNAETTLPPAALQKSMPPPPPAPAIRKAPLVQPVAAPPPAATLPLLPPKPRPIVKRKAAPPESEPSVRPSAELQQTTSPPRQRRRIVPMVPETSEPPYRNTRSRSRSVEPPARVARQRRQRKPQPPVIEEENAEESSQPNPIVVTETLTEEAAVADLLTSQPRSRRQSSMETDDAETDLRLRQGASRASRPYSMILNPPAALFANLRAPSVFTDRSSNLVNQPESSAQSESIIVRRGATYSKRRSGQSENPRTPERRLRGASTSSTEGFPLPNTRASAFKKQMEEEEKRTPYKAPPGTRAASLARR